MSVTTTSPTTSPDQHRHQRGQRDRRDEALRQRRRRRRRARRRQHRFEAGRFTAIMGPSGSGKSTLLHVLAGLDRPTAGTITISGVDITKLSDKKLTLLRRDKLGFIFQSFNLLPTLTAAENITLPIRIAGRKPDQYWIDTIVQTVGLSGRLGTARRSSPAASSSGSPRPGRSRAAPTSSSPTSRRARSTPAPAPSCSASCATPFATSARPVVMVTHDPSAAAYADRVVFLADGRIVDEMTEPTADRVLDYMKTLGA
jgi:putative ABC transport system ATP-binding protein